MVELQPSKLDVASSNLVSRSSIVNIDILIIQDKQKSATTAIAHVAQSVERFLGKEEVHRFDSDRGLHLKSSATLKYFCCVSADFCN